MDMTEIVLTWWQAAGLAMRLNEIPKDDDYIARFGAKRTRF